MKLPDEPLHELISAYGEAWEWVTESQHLTSTARDRQRAEDFLGQIVSEFLRRGLRVRGLGE